MSKRNLMSNAAFDVPADVAEQLAPGFKGAQITEAIQLVSGDPSKLTQALLLRVLSARKVSNPVKVTTTVAQETRDQIELLSQVSGLSKNQVVGLSLEAYFITARLRPDASQKAP